MKTLYKTSAVILASVAMVGCNDLDTAPMSDFVTVNQKEDVLAQDPSMLSASVQGITTMAYPFGNVAGSDYHSDFGIPSLMLFLDSRGSDMVATDTGYNWFADGVTYSDCTMTNGILTTYIWGTMYNQIYAANAVLKVVDLESEDELTRYYAAQALANRANCYFWLAQLYAFTYVGHQTDPCVPLILHDNSDQVAAEGAPRSSVSEVYSQVMADLDMAVNMLTNNSTVRSDKRYVNLATVYGLRCRVNMVMNKWADAASDAKNCINYSGAQPYSMSAVSVPNFYDSADNAWLWAVVVDEQDSPVTTGICNWPSFMGSLNYGYASVGAWRRISEVFYNAIPDTDVRKGWWLNEDAASPNLVNYESLCPGCVKYAQNNIATPYVQVKFAPYQNELYTSTNANDICLMRIEEMILNYAESLAMSGNASQGAQELTSFVQQYRNPTYICTATTPEAVQEAVYQQRRLELWGEGLSYFDFQRLKKNINRRGAGFQEAYVFDIPADDACRIFLIPQRETEANPLLGANNPTPTRPTSVAGEE